MIEPLTEKQKTLIVNNVIKACSDIEKLNRTGYKFLYLANGFIAHYDLNGFKAHYSGHDLAKNILNNVRSNQWNNFRPEDPNFAYYKSKQDVYNRIVSKLTNQALNIWNS